MKKYLLILISILFFSTSGMAQNLAMIDSLKSILPKLSGKEKVKALRDLCYYSGDINFNEAILYGEEAISYAEEIRHENQLGAAYQDLGIVYANSERYQTALELYEKALVIFKGSGNQESEAFILNNIGSIYLDKADYPTALNYLFKALEIKNALGGVKISTTLISIGEAYRAKKDYEKALEYYSQALDSARKNENKGSISKALSSIEIMYRKKGDYVNALDYRMQVIEMDKASNNNHGLAVSYNNLGELYSDQNDLDKALVNFEKSLKIKEALNNQRGIAYTSIKLAKVYSKLKDFSKANELALKSLATYREIGDLYMESNVCKAFSEILQSFGKFEEALFYHKKFSSLKDSVFNVTKEVIISDIETKYQTTKKEAENALLKLETEQQLATIDQKNQQVTLFIIGSLILVILAGLLFRAYRQKNKNNKLLVTQKEELTQLNKTKNRFFGIIAHDLRGPLIALQGISGLLNYNIKKGNIDSLNQIALQIEDSALKVNTLLDNLLKWALSQEGAMPHQPTRLALKPLIEESLHYFKDMAAAKDILLKADVSNDIHVHADRETLTTIFRNLINNSIKFTPHGGSVNLMAVNKKENVQIDVKDNGMGIEEEKLRSIFILDHHKSTSGTEYERGTGLGLVLVNDFVNMNHGTIEIESKLNRGSTFSITLPSKFSKAV